MTVDAHYMLSCEVIIDNHPFLCKMSENESDGVTNERLKTLRFIIQCVESVATETPTAV